MSIQIAAHFTKDTRINNGLHSIQQDLIDDPHTRRMAVCIVEVLETGVRHHDGGVPIVKVNLFAIEPLSGEDAVDARTIMERAMKARTGQPHQASLFDRHPDDDPDEEDGDGGDGHDD